MLLEARVTSIWKKQKLFVAVFLLAMSGWFFFDGKVGYPRSNVRYNAWAKFRNDGHLQDWPDYAKEHGWVEKPPEHAYTDAQINGQFLYGALGALGGIITLIYWLGQKGRVLRLDDEAVTTPAGTRVPFGAITGLGLKNWDSKGLATVRYEIGGQKGSFVVDDYKFEMQPTRQILDEIKAKVTAAQPNEQPVSDAASPGVVTQNVEIPAVEIRPKETRTRKDDPNKDDPF